MVIKHLFVLVITMMFYFVCLVTIKDYKLPEQDSVSKGHSFSDLFILNNENDYTKRWQWLWSTIRPS